jgi:hypothetical protein
LVSVGDFRQGVILLGGFEQFLAKPVDSPQTAISRSSAARSWYFAASVSRGNAVFRDGYRRSLFLLGAFIPTALSADAQIAPNAPSTSTTSAVSRYQGNI